MTKFKNYSILIASFAALAFVFSCSEKMKPKALTGVATFIKGKVFLNGSKMSVGSKVQASDVIKVGKKAGAIVQFSTGALVTLKSKTQLEVSKLVNGADGVPVVNLTQTKGSTFSKIRTGQANYSIKTPTAVAGVRGTSFGVTVKKGKKTEIHLLKGKVAVKSAKVAETQAEPEAMLEAGQKISVTESKGVAKKSEKLTAEETKSLETYNTVEFLPEETINKDAKAIEAEVKAAPEKVVASKIADDVIQEELVIAPKKDDGDSAKKPVKKAKKLTLDDLRAKYGKLTKIITHDKQAYVGGDWKQVGDYHFIRTTKGKKKIKTSQVFKVLPMD